MNSNQILFQDQPGIQDTSEVDDNFGASFAAKDFDGDGFDDLAIGVPVEDITGTFAAGAVNVVGGSSNGIDTDTDQILFQDRLGVQDTSEEFDRFGSSLAAGDFNGDNLNDLAIGVPGEDITGSFAAGAVNIVGGSANGLDVTNSQIWSQDQPGIEGTSRGLDEFGRSLATGDFNNDGFNDLAISSIGEDIGSITDAGAVNVLAGSNNGLTANNNQIWFQDQPGIEGTSEDFDVFGSSLATGDFNGDGFDDLAIGSIGEDIRGIENAGAVNVLAGSNNGLTSDNNQIWFQDQPGVQGTSEVDDSFGSSLAAGDFNGDGFDDLAVGVFGEDIGSINDAGAVNVFAGSNTGLTSDNNQIWFQDQPGIQGTSEDFDGYSNNLGFLSEGLSVGDFNNDGFDDLVVGIAREDIGSITDAGAANIIFGSANGLTA